MESLFILFFSDFIRQFFKKDNIFAPQILLPSFSLASISSQMLADSEQLVLWLKWSAHWHNNMHRHKLCFSTTLLMQPLNIYLLDKYVCKCVYRGLCYPQTADLLLRQPIHNDTRFIFFSHNYWLLWLIPFISSWVCWEWLFFSLVFNISGRRIPIKLSG